MLLFHDVVVDDDDDNDDDDDDDDGDCDVDDEYTSNTITDIIMIMIMMGGCSGILFLNDFRREINAYIFKLINIVTILKYEDEKK